MRRLLLISDETGSNGQPDPTPTVQAPPTFYVPPADNRIPRLEQTVETLLADRERISSLERIVQELTAHVRTLDQWGKIDWTKKGETAR